MRLETFQLERNQTLWENEVEINLTESGVHPLCLRDLLGPEEIEALLGLPLGYGYTDGHPELRDAIASWYPGARRENVLVTSGSAEANFLAVWSLLDPGDELLFMLPNFMQIWGAARGFGIVVTPYYLHPGSRWTVDLDEVRRLVTPKTRMIAVCNPNNPTGAVLDEAALSGLVDIARDAGAYLLADEVYRGSELTGPETPTAFGRTDAALVVSGVSKALAHGGLRIGWVVASPPLIAELARRQDYTTIGSGILNQHVARRFLQPARRADLLARSRRILTQNLQILTEWVEGQEGRVELTPPQAGGMAFLRYRSAVPSVQLSERLRRERGVFVAAGAWFGMDGYFRLGIGGAPDQLRDGLRPLGEFLADPT
jgi:aspartate/methionine/tyrosine aminotransferase